METTNASKLLSREEAHDIISKTEFKIMPKREVKAWIGRIKESVARLDEEIKQCMLQCLAHAKTHGDVTLIEELADSLPPGRWNNGFRQWLYAHSPIRARDDGTFHQLKEGEPGFKAYDLETASQKDPLPRNANGNNRQERTFSLLTINKLVTGLGDRVKRAEEKGELVMSDKPKIMKTVRALNDVITELDLKPSKVIDTTKEDAPKKVKPRLISKKTVERAKSAKAA